MQIEVWSPDGLEAMATGDLMEVLEVENEPGLMLLGDAKGARVYLDEGDVEFLREMLEKTKVGQ